MEPQRPVTSRHEIQKLARVINRELDAALLEAGFMTPDEIAPWENMNPRIRIAIEKAAEGVYNSLVYNAASGEIIVQDKGVKL